MSQRNTPPDDAFDVLRRLYNCNWQQLAARLDVSPRSLNTWRREGPGKTGNERLHRAFHEALREADAQWLTIPIDWTKIDSIGGKR